jgi:hypothetical protein
MYVLHHHLESVEASGLWHLDFRHEALSEVLKHYAVRGSEEGEDHLDKMLLVVGQLRPILQVLLEIDFLGGPESGLMLLVHFPNVRVFDRQNHEAVGILIQERLRQQICIFVRQIFDGNLLV